jgi:adenine-specific DNA-methyltransferase
MIEGENLAVLKALYKSYFGRVKMIYLDPPYNTGNDFIYSDDYTEPLDAYLKATGQMDDEGNVLSSNPETSGRYHSAWLSMMYPRLFMARQLLREDGVVFISIDDNEVHNLRLLMNEIFGEENFIATVVWQKVFAPKNSARYFSGEHDYVLVYARNKEVWRPNLLPRSDEAKARYSNPDDDPRGPWTSGDLTARNPYSEGKYEVTSPSGETYAPPKGRYWTISKESFEELDEDNRIWWGEDGSNMPRLKRFLDEVKDGVVPQTLWPYDEVGHTQEAKKELKKHVTFESTENVFNTVKPPRLVRRMLQIGTDPDSEDIVLDFFAGSAATAQAVLEQNAEDGGNRRYVCVQFPEPLPEPEDELETIADIARARMRNFAEAASEGGDQLSFDDSTDVDTGFKAYRLADTNLREWESQGVEETDELAEQMAMFDAGLKDDVRERDVLVELLLREGFSLNANVRELEVGDNTVYRTEDATEGLRNDEEASEGPSEFLACLDDELHFETFDQLELDDESVFICRDSALDDSLKVNLDLECILKVL